jgi:hypothetical protein
MPPSHFAQFVRTAGKPVIHGYVGRPSVAVAAVVGAAKAAALVVA